MQILVRNVILHLVSISHGAVSAPKMMDVFLETLVRWLRPIAKYYANVCSNNTTFPWFRVNALHTSVAIFSLSLTAKDFGAETSV